VAGKYQFSSPLAAFSDGIEAQLLQREVQRRQQMLDDLTKRRTDAEITGAEEGRRLQRESFEYTQRRDVEEDEHRNTQARTAAAERAAAAEAQREFLAAQAAENRAAAAERAQADREMREVIAKLSASSSAESRAVADQLRAIQAQTAQDKLDTGRAERERTESGARQSTQSALDAVDRLLDSEDVGSNIGAATGAYEMRGFTQGAQDFNAVRDQLVAALALPNLGALKGPMSDKDVIFVKQLATRLGNTRMSAAETRKALIEAQTFLRGKMTGGGSRRYNPATGKIE
jgi:hypothetical protein